MLPRCGLAALEDRKPLLLLPLPPGRRVGDVADRHHRTPSVVPEIEHAPVRSPLLRHTYLPRLRACLRSRFLSALTCAISPCALASSALTLSSAFARHRFRAASRAMR